MSILTNFEISNRQSFFPRICPPGINTVDIVFLVECNETSERLNVEYTITDNGASIAFINNREDDLHELRLDSTATEVADRLRFRSDGGQRKSHRFYVRVTAFFPSDRGGAKTETFQVDIC